MKARERARLRFRDWMRRPEAPTQEELAKLLTDRGVKRSQSWVSKMLSGGPSVSSLDLLAEIMGIKLDDLVDRLPTERSAVEPSLNTKTSDERGCLERYRRLPRQEQNLIIETLKRFQRATLKLPRQETMWDGRERRSGRDRRKAS